MAEVKKPIRELSTEKPEAFVRIDGEDYGLNLSVDANGALDFRDMQEEYQSLGELRGEERTAEVRARVEELSEKMIKFALNAPDDVIDKLDATLRGAVLQAYGEELDERVGPMKRAIARKQGSADSTE